MKDYLLPAELVDKARAVVDANRKAGRKLAVAESCTGGLVCAALTEIPGSSEVLDAGYVTYSNEAKIADLKVSQAMAQGALDSSNADVAVAITGVAGLEGGTPSKPVGTVVFARAERQPGPDDVTADEKLFKNENRAGVRLQAALCALDLLMP